MGMNGAQIKATTTDGTYIYWYLTNRDEAVMFQKWAKRCGVVVRRSSQRCWLKVTS